MYFSNSQDEARLADAGDTDDRDEVCLVLLGTLRGTGL